MKVQETVKRETLKIAAGTIAMSAVMVIAFLLFGYYTNAVIIGAVLGSAAAVLDFFLLGLTVQKAAEIQAAHPIKNAETDDDNAEDESKKLFADPETAKLIKRKVQLSYYGRRAMLVLIAATGLTAFVNLVAVVVPMLFPKLIIQARNVAQKLPRGVK